MLYPGLLFVVEQRMVPEVDKMELLSGCSVQLQPLFIPAPNHHRHILYNGESLFNTLR